MVYHNTEILPVKFQYLFPPSRPLGVGLQPIPEGLKRKVQRPRMLNI